MKSLLRICLCLLVLITNVITKSLTEQLEQDIQDDSNSMALKKHLRLEDAIKTLKMEEKNLKELIKQIQTSDEQDEDEGTDSDLGIDEVTVNQRSEYTGAEMLIAGNEDGKRGVLTSKSAFWPRDDNGEVHIPYVITSSNLTRIALIEKYIGEMNTFIRCNKNVWRRRRDERYYVNITEKPLGCYSYLGRIHISFQPQLLNLGYKCVTRGIVYHELMHAMGFYHEHSRSDRNDYVNILYDNVKRGSEMNFEIKNTNNLNTTYDYGSVMHYRKDSFLRGDLRRSGAVTIETLNKTWQNKIGQRKRLSYLDIKEINLAYKCPDPIAPTTTTAEPTTTTTAEPTTTTTAEQTTTTTAEPTTTTTGEQTTTTTGEQTTTTTAEQTTTTTAEQTTTTTAEQTTTTTADPTTTTTADPTTTTTAEPETLIESCSNWKTKRCSDVRGFEVIDNKILNDALQRWRWRYKGKRKCRDNWRWCPRVRCHSYFRYFCKKTCKLCQPRTTPQPTLPPTEAPGPHDFSYLQLQRNSSTNEKFAFGFAFLQQRKIDIKSRLNCKCNRSKFLNRKDCDRQKFCVKAVYRLRSPYRRAKSVLKICFKQQGVYWWQRYWWESCTTFGKLILELNKWERISYQVDRSYCDGFVAFLKAKVQGSEVIQVSQLEVEAGECEHEGEEEEEFIWKKKEIIKKENLNELSSTLNEIEADIADIQKDFKKNE